MHFATVRCWFPKVAISSRNVKPTLGNQNEHEVFIHLAALSFILYSVFKNNRDRVVYIHHPTRPAWPSRRHILCSKSAQHSRMHLERLNCDFTANRKLRLTGERVCGFRSIFCTIAEPWYNEVLVVTNDLLHSSNGTYYGKELHVTNHRYSKHILRVSWSFVSERTFSLTFPSMPTPASAAWIILTSFPPSPKIKLRQAE